MPSNTFEHAVLSVREGGVIAYPAEAVWGLGCDPFDEQAVRRILAMKQRSEDKGLIVLAASVDHLEPFIVDLPQREIDHLRMVWPAMITFVIEDVNSYFPDYVRGNHSSIAVRVSNHQPLNGLVKACGGLLVSTSANPSGLSPARDHCEAKDYFNDLVDSYGPGEIQVSSAPSQIIRLADQTVIRA